MTTQTNDTGVIQNFTLLNSAAQQRLHTRIDTADGNIDTVRQEVQRELDQLDTQTDEATGQTAQAERAFYVAQITYLDLLEQRAAPEEPKKVSVWARLWPRGR